MPPKRKTKKKSTSTTSSVSVKKSKSVICEKKDTVCDGEIDLAALGANDILIEVFAMALNPVDYKVKDGLARDNGAQKVVGYDGSGKVISVGKKVKKFKTGDDVMFAGDITKNGSAGEFVVVNEKIVSKKPKSWTFADSAALPLVSITAYEAFFEQMRLEESSDKDRIVLIINGAGGVGSIATQLAVKKLKAKTVICTASRKETIDWCKRNGATHTINHRKSLKDEMEALNIAGVDVVLCCVDLELHFDAICEIIRPCGSICAITVGDSSKIDVNKLYFPLRLTLSFELMFTRPMFDQEAERQGKLLQEIADMADAGELQSLVTKTFHGINAKNLKKGFKELESGKAIGKIVITRSEQDGNLLSST